MLLLRRCLLNLFIFFTIFWNHFLSSRVYQPAFCTGSPSSPMSMSTSTFLTIFSSLSRLHVRALGHPPVEAPLARKSEFFFRGFCANKRYRGIRHRLTSSRPLSTRLVLLSQAARRRQGGRGRVHRTTEICTTELKETRSHIYTRMYTRRHAHARIHLRIHTHRLRRRPLRRRLEHPRGRVVISLRGEKPPSLLERQAHTEQQSEFPIRRASSGPSLVGFAYRSINPRAQGDPSDF